MIKKDEAEMAIRSLCHEWQKENEFSSELDFHPSFGAFKTWLDQKGFSVYLNFRSTVGANYDAELWFDEELKQIWRR